MGELKTVTGTTPRLAYVYLGVMVATWAGNWPLMRLALAHTEPMVFVSLRMAGSIAILAPILVVLRRPLLPDPGERLALFWVGLFQVTGFLVFSIIGLAIVAPGRAIVLAYTMPLWAILLGLGWSREVLSPRKLAGATIGFAGLVVFMNPALVNWTNRREVTGNLLLLLAAICWAVGSCVYGRRAWQSSFWAQTFWQLAVGAITIVAPTFVLEADWSVQWTPGFAAILAYNWIVTTALGYFLWNKVLAVMSPAVAGQVLTLTPISGFLLSTLIFGGAITTDIVAGILLIAIGLVLTLRQ
ncbi:MAG TPA: DMT family transporter [Stellaceae bacterium]|nr:DMT family transporter [Stellaceae bacterium]